MKNLKELAKIGREYLLHLEGNYQVYVRVQNKKELYEELSSETSPKKENDGNPK